MQAQPQNQKAKDLLADVFEQLGYQQENPGTKGRQAPPAAAVDPFAATTVQPDVAE